MIYIYSSCSTMYLKQYGLNLYPSALKNLFWNSTQCKRRVCKKHSIKSMHIKTANVILAKMKNPITIYVLKIIKYHNYIS